MKHIYIAAILTGCLLGGIWHVYATPDTRLISYQTVIDEGETLWDVCAEVASDKDNLNELVWRTAKENGITDPGHIMPGTTVMVRVEPIAGGAE